MRRRLLAVLSVGAMVAALAAGVAPASGAGGSAPRLRNLDPGGPARFSEKVPVNVVFLGYEPDQVGKAAYLSGLPKKLRAGGPLPGWPTASTEKLGITYTYDYGVTYAGEPTRRSSSAAGRLAKPAPLTASRRSTTPGEQRPGRHEQPLHRRAHGRAVAGLPPARGVDTRRNTIFFDQLVRPRRLQVPRLHQDRRARPRHRLQLRRQRQSRKIIAWGGTTADDEENGLGSTRRVWFHDLSAGPESWTGNWNVDDADLDGDGVDDYRMPPIWEYGGGFRRARRAGRRPRAGHPLRRAQPAVHHLAALPGRAAHRGPAEHDQPRQQHLRGLAGGRRVGRVHQARAARRGAVGARWRNPLDFDNQDLPFDRQGRSATTGCSTGRVLLPRTGLPGRSRTCSCTTRELSGPRTTPAGSTTSCRCSTTRSTGTRRAGCSASPTTTSVDGTQSYVSTFVSPGRSSRPATA